MSKFIAMSAAALLVASSTIPATAVSGPYETYEFHLSSVSQTQCTGVSKSASAARGSIYDMAGHTSCNYGSVQVLVCRITTRVFAGNNLLSINVRIGSPSECAR